jgi:RNA polymerase sigma-70 factor, ECF subfamily
MLSEIYTRHAPDVFRFALYLSGNRADAEDLCSETFVHAWTAAEPVRMSTVKGYLFTIARNLYLQSLRASRRQVELDDRLRDPGPSPSARAEQRSEVEAALAGLQMLPESDRAALAMRAFGELSYDEIARSLGISLAATKVKIHRARRALIEQRKRGAL